MFGAEIPDNKKVNERPVTMEHLVSACIWGNPTVSKN